MQKGVGTGAKSADDFAVKGAGGSKGTTYFVKSESGFVGLSNEVCHADHTHC